MRYVGLKQVQKNIKENKVKKVFIAKDVEEHILEMILKQCKDKSIPVAYVDTMAELGKMAGIDVSASCTAE